MSEKYDLANLIYIGEQYETERKLSRWSLDGGLALAVLRDIQAANARISTLQREADELRAALATIAGGHIDLQFNELSGRPLWHTAFVQLQSIARAALNGSELRSDQLEQGVADAAAKAEE